MRSKPEALTVPGVEVAILVFVLTAGLGVPGQFIKEGRGVCSKQTHKVPLFYNESFLQPVYHPYITTCKGLRICSTYRTTYKVAFRQVKKEVLQTSYICCPGWKKKHPSANNCDEAVCRKPCQNGGICTRPNVCECRPGWGGKYCHVDVDECRAPVPLCTHLCMNTVGSYRCTCHAGFSLSEDGTSCEKHIATTSAPLPASESWDAASDRLSNEVQELRSKVRSLEERIEWTVNTFQKLVPMKLEDIKSEHVLELWARIQQLDQLDQVESLSNQLMYMEEMMGTCSCRDKETVLNVDLNSR
ncbi:epidermal growth factor-like protein 8 [Ambystoma mexicanum]|uniref:epidermal growth factor-like protein 8 n=1 Tax=Ambystoma mexicanum TaxID=8296 RepID=UPI0037E9C18B